MTLASEDPLPLSWCPWPETHHRSVVSDHVPIDLALCFQAGFLQPILLAVILFAFIARVLHLRTRPTINPADPRLHTSKWTRVLAFKQAVAAFAAMTTLVFLVLHGYRSLHLGLTWSGLGLSGAEALAMSMQFITFLMATHLHALEFAFSLLPSTVLTVAYLLLAVVNAAYLRSLVALGHPSVPWHVALASSTMVLLLLESVSVRGGEIITALKYPPEFASTLLSRILLTWVYPLIRLGNAKFLTLDDLWQLHPRDQVTSSATRLAHILRMHPDSSFAFNLLRHSGWAWLGITCLFFSSVLLPLGLPWLLGHLLRHVSMSNPDPFAGILLALGYLIVFCAGEFTADTAHTLKHLAVARLRSTLMSAMYAKSLRLAHSGGGHSKHSAQILTRLQVDAENLAEILEPLLPLPSILACILAGFAWLWTTMGAASLFGILILSAFIPLNHLAGKVLVRSMAAKLKHMDARVHATRESIFGIRTLRMFGWTRAFARRIHAHRVQEMACQMRVWTVEAVQYSLFYFIPNMASLAMFATFTWVSGGEKLSAERVFVALSSVQTTKAWLHSAIWSVWPLVQGWASYQRVSEFMRADERTEYVKSTVASDEGKVVVVEDVSVTWPDGSVGKRASPASTSEPAADLGSEASPLLSSVAAAHGPRVAPVLSNINLTLSRGSLTLVTGPVGSGKSSLLATLAGEMHLLAGSVRLAPGLRVAYVPQRAWIQSGTIRSNILWNHEMDEQWYRRVLDACALMPDLDQWEAGDLEVIGERGINLSGGQKARIALARAIYCTADVFLLDDVLSAVDVLVDAHLFANVFGPRGLLAGKTVVLVTHAVHHMLEVDRVVIMSDGTIAEQGAPAELEKIHRGRFGWLMDGHGKRNDGQVVVDERHGQPHAPTEAGGYGTLVVDTVAAEKRVDSESSSDDESIADSDLESEDEQNESVQRGSVSSAVYGRYFGYAGFPQLALLVALSVFAITFETLTSYWSGTWGQASEASTAPDAPAPSMTFYVLGLSASLRAATSMSNDLLSKVLTLPMTFFDSTPSGRLINRFSRDMKTIDSDLPNSAFDGLYVSLLTTGMLVSISLATPPFIALLVVLIAIYWYLQRLYLNASREIQRINSITLSPLYQAFTETLDGMATIRVASMSTGGSVSSASSPSPLSPNTSTSGSRSSLSTISPSSASSSSALAQAPTTPLVAFQQLTDLRIDTYMRTQYALIVTGQWLKRGLKLISAGIIFSAALLAVLFPSQGVVLIGLGLTQAQNATWVLDELVELFCKVENEMVAVERVLEYVDLTSEHQVVGGAGQEADVDAEWPANGTITFDQVGARYQEDQPHVLKSLSFAIRAGEKVALVGRTGSGKSSCVAALFRLLELSTGRILVDNVDIARVPLDTLRSRLTIVPQDCFVFEADVRENVDPRPDGERVSDQDVWSALDAVGLGELVRRLPSRLDEPIKGVLSAGQLQLLCLARAIVRRSTVLVLDEASSSLDNSTDGLVQQVIRGPVFEKCTVLTIAHRIASVMDYDRILVLDQGQLMECDSPKSLLANPKSTFYRLAHQAGLVAN
ncbi:hypothetical protein BCR44DRAFT_1441906 [Catenaria anguillulae PL171]|uniref:P-loop containing nucleoside triphosphate hydrolase protein n=1 Tax=Catenaria anguillulae PL171 TaxID=765915 RepID=A0A1Y2HAL4_9FUNG|nr:hypothetical protein BCR44DRAFT_1441906 [Catenaria anguillulae PL171]